MPFICMRRQDIPSGVLQVTDLWPRKSLSGSIFNPVPQGPVYARQPDNERVFEATVGTLTVLRKDFTGLAAYLIDNISDAGGVVGSADANTMAADLITAMRAGSALEAGDVNTLLAAVVAGTSLTGGGSTATLGEVLGLLGGDTYQVPANTEIADGGATSARAGSFLNSRHANVFQTGYFDASLAAGDMSVYSDADYVYSDVTGAAIVVYADDGTVL